MPMSTLAFAGSAMTAISRATKAYGLTSLLSSSSFPAAPTRWRLAACPASAVSAASPSRALPLAGAGLGLAWAVSGGCMLVGSVVGNRVDGLLPAAPALPGAVVREGVPFLLYGLGAWWIGNVDVVLARAAHHPDDVGALQVGTMAVRGLALIP